MKRETGSLTITQLRAEFVDIAFPEYQREPDIWSRDQKQRLIDSILRRFDIASVYLYVRDGAGFDCIDGRQRLNAIMSFLGDNPADKADEGFALKIENEISSGLQTDYDKLDGLTFKQLKDLAIDEGSDLREAASSAIEVIEGYAITTVMVSDVANDEEFNLQFLRLNLGAIINAGEKLHAMVGDMREVVFTSERVGKHPFFGFVSIPDRRYAKELTAAQVLLQAFSIREKGEFDRGRHLDLQRFVKRYAEVAPEQPLIEEVASTLDALRDGAEDATDYLRNRAVTVSLVILAWKRNVRTGDLPATEFWEFIKNFLTRLRWQVNKMKSFDVDGEYPHLVEFQRHLTQASVEKPAFARRDEILQANLDLWLSEGRLVGDADYQTRTGAMPGG